jgi:hypothetical protein
LAVQLFWFCSHSVRRKCWPMRRYPFWEVYVFYLSSSESIKDR